MPDFLRLALMVLLLAFSGFFSGSESALFSLDALLLRRLRRGGGAGAIAARLLEEPDSLLISILFGNMLVNVAYIVLAAGISYELHGRGAALAWDATALLALIIFGEVTPKAIAVSNPPLAARLVALPMLLVTGTLGKYLLLPFGRLIRSGRHVRHAAVRPEDLKYLVELSARRKRISASEREMLADAIALAEVKVKEIMVPSVEAATVNNGATVGDVLARAAAAAVHFMPVLDARTDEVCGVVDSIHCLSLVAEAGDKARRQPVTAVMKRPVFVPETATCSRLLKTFREKPAESLLVVVDEYGGFAGLVTAEDLVEEVLGPLRDEYDAALEFEAAEVAPGVFRVPGDLPIREWFESLAMPTEDMPVSTIAGFFVYLLGRLPRQGENVRYGGLRLVADKVAGKRLLEVLVEVEATA